MEIKQYYEMFRDFKGMLVDKGYELTLHKNNINAIETIERMDKANAISFLIYIFEFWYAYTMDIINGNFDYINMTNMVLESFYEYMDLSAI